MKKYCASILSGLALAGGIIQSAEASVCQSLPGSVVCGAGVVEQLSGNGTVTVNGTTVNGPTNVNGLLSATDASFSNLDINGSANFIQCTINGEASIKGSLNASSTKFESSLEIYSNEVRFINSKISGDLHVSHTDSRKHVVFLDNFSEVGGNIVFDDKNGEVVIRGGSKVNGQIIGGNSVAR